MGIGVYFLLYHQDKFLQFVPKNAEIIVLVDLKKAARQSLFTFATHPSKWFKSTENKNPLTLLKNSGIKIPDYLQLFHLKDTQPGFWYAVVELKSEKKFKVFLKNRKFVERRPNYYENGVLQASIFEGKCLLSTSPENIQKVEKDFEKQEIGGFFEADQFSTKSAMSISLLSKNKIRNFEVIFNEDEIEIGNTPETAEFRTLIKKLHLKNTIFNLELDKKNLQNFGSYFSKNLSDSAHISSINAVAIIEKVKDTVITYDYDDNFNEVETKRFQNRIQPNFSAVIGTSDATKTWNYFQNHHWINAKNEFILFPLETHLTSKMKDEILISSKRNPIKLTQSLKGNYAFLQNNDLFTSLKSYNDLGKSLITNLDYFFYGNIGEKYYVKFKFKKGKMNSFLNFD